MDPRCRNEATALYRLYDAADVLLYVGATHNPKARWYNHQRERAWWPQVARIEMTWLNSRSEALQAERKVIASEEPLHNTDHHPVNAPAALARRRHDAIRWARGRDHEPYPPDVELDDVIADLTKEQRRALAATLHLAGISIPKATP
jgi:predicted GIY-YIG superfamily endonuclease